MDRNQESWQVVWPVLSDRRREPVFLIATKEANPIIVLGFALDPGCWIDGELLVVNPHPEHKRKGRLVSVAGCRGPVALVRLLEQPFLDIFLCYAFRWTLVEVFPNDGQF